MRWELPTILKEKMNLAQAKLPPIGFSPETMYLIKGGYGGKDCTLKYSKRIEVYEEGAIYSWLKGKLPVPEVYFNEKIGDTYYLVTELVTGEMFAEAFQKMATDEFLKEYASLLRKIHAVDYNDFPFVHDLDYKLNKVKETVFHHEAKEQYFERELKGKSPEYLLDYLLTHQDFDQDLVFCHGDVCFPNFMYENNQLKAVLDVSGAGVNDRYLDIAIALRTLRYNFEMIQKEFTKEHQEQFLKYYGIEELDMDKVTFFILLDELTNG